MRALVIGTTAIIVLAITMVLVAMRSESGQDSLLATALASTMSAAPQAPPAGGIRVFMCGTSSPLPTPDRAQACVAVLVDERIYIVDAGAGSANVASLARLPLQHLQAILLTHFHSDHIAAIQDFNLMSWVAGRPAPLSVMGPEGVEGVVEGFNRAYDLDREYRVAHHGRDLLDPALHVLQARTLTPGPVLEENGLVIRAFVVDHDPVSPAVGYRFDYGGRSVVITGDTVVTQGLERAAQDADLLLSDAISLPIVRAMEQAARAAGRDRNAKILADIQDYHADASTLGGLAERAGVGQLALYHLVPAPRNAVMENIFRRDLPDAAVLTEDGMVFDLPADSDAILIDP